MLFFPILLFWQKTNFLPSSFWHRVPLNLNLFGRNGKTSMAVQWERSYWSRDDSISFHSMAMLIPSHQIALKSNHHLRLPAGAAYSVWRSDFKANGTSVTSFPIFLNLGYIHSRAFSSYVIRSVKGYDHTTSRLFFTQSFKCNHIID